MADDSLRALVTRVGEFYVTDRALRIAQKKIEETLASGAVDEQTERSYLETVRRYFTGFEKEARAHLRDVDKRLEHLNQVHFNLTAERGVAVRRIEATQGVLGELERVANLQRH
jgi:hypothetical protein